ncbi:MAG TPA: hypothetical protein VNB49_00725 [Candidatus Dormibacteraeota bacterium]|nr:hypothetical protein [Candidatus Dormibacteraeota bacterium]
MLTPNANYLLSQKCETFLDHRNVKARDALDIHLLLSREAKLDKTLRPYLEDFIVTKELDKESIKARIVAISPELCTVELRPVLPPPLFEGPAKEGLRATLPKLRTVFSDWLAVGRR